MTGRTKAWQCTGCGRLESQQTCIGVCQDRPVEIVSAAHYDAAKEEAESAQRRLDELRLFLRQLASVSPRRGEWESSYKALQRRVLRLLAESR